MKTKEEILIKNGVDWDLFEIENEYSAKNILNAMEEYANEVRLSLTAETMGLKEKNGGWIKKSDVLNAIPHNWLDSLLTGEKSVIHDPITAKDIEVLFLAVRARIENIPTPPTEGI